MKKWSKPEVFDLIVECTEWDSTGGHVDGGWIANPSNPNANLHADQPVPGHS